MKPAKFYNDCEMDNLEYYDAKKIDGRTFGQIYISQIKTKNIFIFTFGTKEDYNSTEIKICFFGFLLIVLSRHYSLMIRLCTKYIRLKENIILFIKLN